MVINVANGNPVIAVVLMSLSTFKNTILIASFKSFKLVFSSEEAAQKFAEEVRSLGCASKIESTNVVVFPDFGGSKHAAKAVYRAVDAYKDSLVSVNEFEMTSLSEVDNNLLKEIEQYLKEYFGADAVTIAVNLPDLEKLNIGPTTVIDNNIGFTNQN